MNKLLFWAPRLLTIAFILFLGLFALDSFDGDKNLIHKIGGFVIHLIPNFILILVLILAWKHEWVGTIAFVLLGFVYLVISWGKYPVVNYVLISGSLFLIGVLFWAGWLNRRRNRKKNDWNPLYGE